MSLLNVVNNSRNAKGDTMYTPSIVAKRMIEMCEIKPSHSVLDPCYGGGVFYDNLPVCRKHYCEIEMDRDFFELHGHFDLVIGNPPYSKWSDWIKHTATLTNRFCYIIGALNLSANRVALIHELGFSIVKMEIVTIQYWFGQNFIILCERTKKPSLLSVMNPAMVKCEECGKSCPRRIPNMNQCANKAKLSTSETSSQPTSGLA